MATKEACALFSVPIVSNTLVEIKQSWVYVWIRMRVCACHQRLPVCVSPKHCLMLLCRHSNRGVLDVG